MHTRLLPNGRVNEPRAFQMQARPFFRRINAAAIVFVVVVVGIPTPMPDLLARVCVRGACDSPGSTHRCPAVVTAEHVVTKKSKPCFSFLEKKNRSINTVDDHRHSPRLYNILMICVGTKMRHPPRRHLSCVLSRVAVRARVSHTKNNPMLHVYPAGGPMQQQQLRSAISFYSYRRNILLILSLSFFTPTLIPTSPHSSPCSVHIVACKGTRTNRGLCRRSMTSVFLGLLRYYFPPTVRERKYARRSAPPPPRADSLTLRRSAAFGSSRQSLVLLIAGA